MRDGQTPIGEEKRLLCDYCEKREAVEWSDEGRRQCADCSPTRSTEKADDPAGGPDK